MSHDVTVTQALVSRRSSHRIILDYLQLPEAEMVICEVSPGYAPSTQPEKARASKRENVDDFVCCLR